jgi:EAL domain-containing protein (putative c-di-GMP-specific phosphodiesterase class I)/CheY-like chemotaxis protein
MPPATIPSDLRYLVVEDQGFQLWMTGQMLEELGARYVFRAADGAAALALLRDREPPIDVIVSDIDMPGMDGMELMRHLGSARYPASVIFASALEQRLLASVESMARAYGVTVLGVIAKPVTAKKLQAVLARHEPASLVQQAALQPTFSAEEIRAGIERGELVAFFQPKVDLVTGIARGAEALARWKHPQHGLVRPDRFIAAAEQGGLVDALTLRMLELAVANCLRWHGASIETSVAINISAASLHDTEFATRLWRTVVDAGLDPAHVIFELTESMAAVDHGSFLENLSRLRMKGFGLSIDDFGTGYSSMERLAAAAFTELKVDQSFVRAALTQEPARAMLESGLEMARKLGITSVAEGIESRFEWELVRSLGCDLAQGYFIQKPMDPADYSAWLTSPHRDSA